MPQCDFNWSITFVFDETGKVVREAPYFQHLHVSYKGCVQSGSEGGTHCSCIDVSVSWNTFESTNWFPAATSERHKLPKLQHHLFPKLTDHKERREWPSFSSTRHLCVGKWTESLDLWIISSVWEEKKVGLELLGNCSALGFHLCNNSTWNAVSCFGSPGQEICGCTGANLRERCQGRQGADTRGVPGEVRRTGSKPNCTQPWATWSNRRTSEPGGGPIQHPVCSPLWESVSNDPHASHLHWWAQSSSCRSVD